MEEEQQKKRKKESESLDVKKLKRAKRVGFAEEVTVYSVPGQEEDRRGTWALDVLRERMRAMCIDDVDRKGGM